MFELSIAFKYLTPRWRQLSVSIISLISILVIALVVWLIVVFFSVTYGLERNWIDRLIALTAPVRMLPTDSYYDSYYYRIDSVSSASGYTPKSIAEKQLASLTDPYDPSFDEELPGSWPKPDLDEAGKLKDPVKGAFGAILELRQIPDLTAHDYEMTMGNLKLQLLRQTEGLSFTQATMSQATYLGSFDPDNKALQGALVRFSMQDLSNQLAMSGVASDDAVPVAADVLRERLKQFFSQVTVRGLAIPSSGWLLNRALFPQTATWTVFAHLKGDQISRVFIPVQKQELDAGLLKGQLVFKEGEPSLHFPAKEPQPLHAPLILVGDLGMEATLDPLSLETAMRPQGVRFDVRFQVQGTELKGQTPYGNLTIQHADMKPRKLELPKDPLLGNGILLPRGFKDAGVLVGDRGAMVYVIPTASSLQEQRLPVFVAGFYDPGIIPIGGKFVIVNQEITNLIRSAYNQDDLVQGNGINVRFSNLDQADLVKKELESKLQAAGIAPYWKVETFREYEFTKDVIQQLRSEKNLFTLLATIIIVVACSNIVSMLIILVNDKKLEIGILRSMGATSQSIALIFGICGIIMGVLGSAIGILAALLTLRHLQTLVNFISRMQGHDLFNPIYYGETLPTALSWESIAFVIMTTAFISLVSGLVPAIKASMMRPSAILRAE